MEVKRLQLSEELVSKFGIIDVSYNSEKIEIIYTRIDGKEDVITLQVGKYGYETINQLDSLINGSMSFEAFTHLKWYLEQKLIPVWDEIYIPGNGNVNGKAKKQQKEKASQKEKNTN